ncbi:uncharacterized protein FIBRA_00388 [Fibroporia radiculosa]|uniref:Dethiobiotin synthase n=1 Tax=Fibroporia radiculosa TaxID=599839 RepID=J4G059_9APHY|nr:uncharacterized protein FIBRA_00388 [Fibroporia radiculosa]CCL98393.1 predicted protein [Fibroporia radiculosa]
MSLLFKHLRIHQVFGANTDVGKTILTTALVRASAASGVPVHYLKPVSTGRMEDADDMHIERFAGAQNKMIQSACLYRFGEPVSPHLAAKLAGTESHRQLEVPSDADFLTTVSSHIRQSAASSAQNSHMYVETAGGVHSPTLSGTTQADCYRPLFLPTVLVGDANLGGISSTISAYESLLLRGYIVDLILLFRDEYYRNAEYLDPYFAERGIRLLSLERPHSRLANPRDERVEMERYYSRLVPEQKQGGIFDALGHLGSCHEKRIAELDSMPQRALNTLWWPFVQHGLVVSKADVNVIDSASHDFFSVYNGHKTNPHPETSSSMSSVPSASSSSLLEPQLDGSASWWTQALGHAKSALTLAAARAAGRYGHVMYPQAVHAPALQLAERLIHSGPGHGWASRVFFSDDGSTGMEVALKMALRAFAVRHGIVGAARKQLGVLGLRGSYHGDTIGAMDACEEGVYTCEWHQARGYWLDAPTIGNRKGRIDISLLPAIAEDAGYDHVEVGSLHEAYDVRSRLSTPLAAVYRRFVERTLKKLKENGGPTLGALVLEPLVMGAGGMIFVDPLFQRVLVDIVRGSSPLREGEWSGLPVVFDEVFVGLYRLGVRSASSILGAYPDISVHAKILTGGLVPLAATLASDSIFSTFLSENKTDALLHGHSYTAYPVGCEVANETLAIVEELAASSAWDDARMRWGAPIGEGERQTAVWSFWDPAFVSRIAALNCVSEVMALGTVLAVHIRDEAAGYQSHSAHKMLEPLNLRTDDALPSSAPGGAPFGFHYRTLGNVAYFMLSLNTPSDVVRAVEERILVTLQATDTV